MCTAKNAGLQAVHTNTGCDFLKLSIKFSVMLALSHSECSETSAENSHIFSKI